MSQSGNACVVNSPIGNDLMRVDIATPDKRESAFALFLPVLDPSVPSIQFPSWLTSMAREGTSFNFSTVSPKSSTAQAGKQLHVQLGGPVFGRSDWETCWSLYALNRRSLLRSIARQLSPLVWDESCKNQLCAVTVTGQEYVFEILESELRDIPKPQVLYGGVVDADGCLVDPNGSPPAVSFVVVDSVTPWLPPEVFYRTQPIPGIDLFSVLTSICHNGPLLFHGAPMDLIPSSDGLNWNAFDLCVNACTDSALSNILRNIAFSGPNLVNDLIIWSADYVPGEVLVRLISLAEDISKVRLVFVCHKLMNVDKKLIDAIRSDGIMLVSRKYVDPTDEVPRAPIAIPDVSRLPPESIELANMYFVTPLVYPHLVSQFTSVLPNLDVPRLLIHGPSQSGKSTLAKWIIAKVTEERSDINVIEVQASSLFGKYLGQSERRLQKLFKRAAVSSPSILLIEGVHALCPVRQDEDETGTGDTYMRMVATFLMCLDGIDTNVNKVSVIATSLLDPAHLDPAAVRSGRLETWISLAPEVNAGVVGVDEVDEADE